MGYPFREVRPGLYVRVPGPPWDARADYIRRWREEHDGLVYGETWTCPLCRVVVQANSASERHERFLRVLIARHQQGHGDDWINYEALAAATPS